MNRTKFRGSIGVRFVLSAAATLLTGCVAPPNYHYTNVRYVDSFNGSANQRTETHTAHQYGVHGYDSRYWGSAQHQTRLLRQAQVSRGAVLADDAYYGVSAFSFVNCGVVDLVGSDGLGLFSVAQPVCTTTTSTLSELDIYPR